MAAAPPEEAGRQDGGATPQLAIIIVNWRRRQETIECCRGLLAWESLRAQVIVADNGSDDATLDAIRQELPEVTLVTSATNRGFGGANNLALESVSADFVLLLNNDAELGEAAARLLVDFMQSDSRAGIAGPVLEAAGPPYPILAAGGRDILRHGRTHSSEEEAIRQLEAGTPFEVHYVPGTAALVRTQLLRDLGGLDEDYFFSGELADLARRVKGRGFGSFIVPRARARHDLAVASELRQSLYAYYSLRNRFLYARRHRRWPQLDLFRWAARGWLSGLAALLRGQRQRARCLTIAVADGLAGRFGPASAKVQP